MQSGLRRTVAKWTTVALFGLLIASFALWGIGDIFRGGAHGTAVMQVGDAEISQNEFARTFQREFSRVRQRLGGELDIETAKSMGLVDQIVRQTITRELFTQQAKDMGLLVADEQVVQEIRQQPGFQNSTGGFDRHVFETTLRRAGYSEAQYIEEVRSNIHRQRLVEATTGGLRVPESLAATLYRYRNEKRVATYTEIERDSFKADEPSESELHTYYEENGDAFMAPAYREITLVHLKADDLLDEVQVSEEELREAYESRKSSLGSPERRHIEQIVFDDKAQAEAAAERAHGGEDFAAVAEDMTGQAPIDLGASTREDMLPGLVDSVFALSEGDVSAPIETALGWHVVKVNKVEAGSSPSFDDARDQLRKELARDEAVNSLVELANRLDDSLAGGARLEEAAAEVGAELRHIPAISRDGNTPDGKAVENLPEKQTFLETAFDTPEGQQSLLRETAAGDYFVLRVDSVTPEQRQPFAEVEEKVRERFLRDARQEKARDLAQTIVKSVDGGVSLAQAAKTAGLQSQTSKPLGRRPSPESSPAELAIAGALFELKPGEATTSDTEKGVVVAALSEIQAADPSAHPSEVETLRQQVAQSMRNDLLSQFANSLQQMHEVQVNRGRLEQVVNRFQ
jgi:peptidyl-prolyl cis-trans isomerase D